MREVPSLSSRFPAIGILLMGITAIMTEAIVPQKKTRLAI